MRHFKFFVALGLLALGGAGLIFGGLPIGATAALAQAPVAPPGSASINLAPLMEQGFLLLNALLVAVVTAGVAWIIAFLKRKTGIDLGLLEAADNQMLHAGIRRGINALEGAAREQIYGRGLHTIDVNSLAVAAVANRMLELSPGLLARMGVSEEKLKRLVKDALTAEAAAPVLVEGYAADLLPGAGAPAS